MFKSRADLLIAAGESIKMQEKACIEPICKHMGYLKKIDSMYMLEQDKSSYEFPLAVVEGKPVFVGDELYCEDGTKFIAYEMYENTFICEKGYNERGYGISKYPDNCSWNPPKPATVMVELSIDDAKFYAYNGCSEKLDKACRKALEETK